jgi:hypothetical protein
MLTSICIIYRHLFICSYIFIWTSKYSLSLLICVYFYAHYRCLFGWVYVFYVGHIEVGRNPFPCCTYLNKDHTHTHTHIPSCPQCSAPRKRYAKKVGDKWGVTNDGEYIICVHSVYTCIFIYAVMCMKPCENIDMYTYIHTNVTHNYINSCNNIRKYCII